MRALSLFVLLACLTSPLCLKASEAEDRAQDFAQMKQVWEALMSFQKARGKLPERLSELVPEFLPDPQVLISPRDDGRKQNGPLTLKEDKHPSSYCYEWGPPKFGPYTFTEAKTCQVEEYGPVVPLLRCFLYHPTPNISHVGDAYETTETWEFDPVVQEIIARRGLGPGMSRGKFLALTARGSDGKPVAGARVTMRHRGLDGLSLPVRTITTDVEGRARMPFGPVPGMFGVVECEKPGYFIFPVASGETGFPDELEIRLQTARPISGRVTDPAGRPLPKAKVLLWRAAAENTPEHPGQWFEDRGGRTPPDRIALAETNDEGNWRLDAFPTDPAVKVTIAVSHPDFTVRFLLLTQTDLEHAGYFEAKARLTLEAPARVRGILRDALGHPVSGAPIFLFPSPDPTAATPALTPAEGKTGEHGEFELPKRVPGWFNLIALPKGLTPIRKGFEAKAAAQDIEVRLPPQGRLLIGRVVDKQKRPVPGIQILFAGWQDGYPQFPFPVQPMIATTDTLGNWQWPEAPTGLLFGRIIFPSGNFGGWGERANEPVEIEVPPSEM